MSQDKLLALALERLEAIRRKEAFDPAHLESRPTTKQQEFFDDFGKYKQYYLRAGNQSGKSQTAARMLTQILLEDHELVARRRAEPGQNGWGNEPLLAIVAGRTGKQLEDSLLPKIRSYLEPGTYREVRMGNAIQRLELDNGNRIVFQSLENPNTARERLQSYVAHITWVDELPPTLDLIREVLVRTQARDGYSVFSFTPLTVNVDIQRFVDAIEPPEGKVYRFKMLDNPLYSDLQRREELIKRYAHLPQYQRDAIFEGDWMTAEDQVYHFDYESMVRMPENYSTLWRHVEAVDPAISSATGLTIWAEDPSTSTWYCILSEYIKGIQVPTDIVKTVQYYTSKVNIVRRISDYAPWYVNTASSMGITYMTVDSKNANRKEELIKNLQESLGKEMIITPNCQGLIDEIQDCRWSNRGEAKIVNSSSYHLLDSAQYARDILPPPEKKLQSFTVDQWYATLLQSNEKRKQLEEKAAERLAKPRGRPVRIKRGVMWR
jgi:phage terminase large subunit-like protein